MRSGIVKLHEASAWFLGLTEKVKRNWSKVKVNRGRDERRGKDTLREKRVRLKTSWSFLRGFDVCRASVLKSLLEKSCYLRKMMRG